jgi:FlaA1/EpsC-like NDP-sugar epimerase
MPRRQTYRLLLDILIGGVAYYFAFVLRFSSLTFSKDFEIFLKTLPFVVVMKVIIFHFLGLHKGIWRYASIQDLIDILKATTLTTLSVIFVIFTLSRGEGYPRSVLIIDWFLTVALLGGMRFVARIKTETAKSPLSQRTRVLIVGAGDAGTMILKEIKSNPQTGYNPIGFIDDNAAKQGRTIQGVAILGAYDDIPQIVYKYGVQEIIIAIPSASGKQLRKIVNQCKKSKAKFKTLPALADVINGTVSVSQVKDVDVIDLLRREPIELDSKSVSLHLFEKTVMITGAGGSIGGELCRQIAKFHPRELVLVDMAETPLFWIELSLREEFPNLNITPCLADIKNAQRVGEIIEKARPEIIYHAAAYKHVPMIEKNALEGIRNNIFGTQTLADLADKHEVESFVMISTDKAVNPRSFMGISKRINELYVQAMAKESKTKFVSVRFGNVLDSSGSCFPIFKRQIKANMPITITHPDVKRFFMTLPEAGQLIVEAGAMGKGGEIFILKMGEQVKIMDIAKDLVSFSGGNPDETEFTIIGLRPGEKLEEELVNKNEEVQLTRDKKILVVRSNNHVPYSDFLDALDEMRQHVKARNVSRAVEQCKLIVSTYS